MFGLSPVLFNVLIWSVLPLWYVWNKIFPAMIQIMTFMKLNRKIRLVSAGLNYWSGNTHDHVYTMNKATPVYEFKHHFLFLPLL